MTKVTITEASVQPAAQIVAPKAFDVTDETGRVITLKKPSPLARLDFAKAAGNGSAAGVNQVYLAMTAHLQFVAAIDGAAVPVPTTEGELRALYARLGDEGNEAAQAGVYKHFMTAADAESAEKN